MATNAEDKQFPGVENGKSVLEENSCEVIKCINVKDKDQRKIDQSKSQIKTSKVKFEKLKDEISTRFEDGNNITSLTKFQELLAEICLKKEYFQKKILEMSYEVNHKQNFGFPCQECNQTLDNQKSEMNIKRMSVNVN